MNKTYFCSYSFALYFFSHLGYFFRNEKKPNFFGVGTGSNLMGGKMVGDNFNLVVKDFAHP